MRRRLLDEGGGGICTLTIAFNPGVNVIKVKGVNYYTPTVLQFPIGTSIQWSATAATGYQINPKGTQTLVLTEKEMTISPTAEVIYYKVYIITKVTYDVEKYLKVTIDGVTTTYTSDTTLSLPYGTVINWESEPGANNIVTASNTGKVTVKGTTYVQSYYSDPVIYILGSNECYVNWAGAGYITIKITPSLGLGDPVTIYMEYAQNYNDSCDLTDEEIYKLADSCNSWPQASAEIINMASYGYNYDKLEKFPYKYVILRTYTNGYAQDIQVPIK